MLFMCYIAGKLISYEEYPLILSSFTKPGKTLAGPATFSFVLDHMSDIKLPVKHTSPHKVCQKFC